MATMTREARIRGEKLQRERERGRRAFRSRHVCQNCKLLRTGCQVVFVESVTKPQCSLLRKMSPLWGLSAHSLIRVLNRCRSSSWPFAMLGEEAKNLVERPQGMAVVHRVSKTCDQRSNTLQLVHTLLLFRHELSHNLQASARSSLMLAGE
jgi:hypothetical protein